MTFWAWRTRLVPLPLLLLFFFLVFPLLSTADSGLCKGVSVFEGSAAKF